MKKYFLLLLIVPITLLSFGQGLSSQETVDYINSKLPDVFKVKVEKDYEMFIEFYSNGDLYRTDRVYLPTIDPSKTKYTKDEESLSLYCLSEQEKQFRKFSEGCFERTFHNKGMIKPYQRCNIPIGHDEKTVAGLTKAFEHLVRISTDEGDYVGVNSFE